MLRFSRDGDPELCSGDPELSYPVASVTKTFTAALCLDPEVRAHLDRPFMEVLPIFRLQREDATRRMTPRHALCHFSGLQPETAAWVDNPQSRRDFVATRLADFVCAPDWREKHRYSNVMYAVLGLWLEDRTGETWERLIEKRIRCPLGLDSLTFLEPGWEEDCLPPTELRDGHPVEIPPFYSRKKHLIAPASELRMTVQDLARWGQHHLRLDLEDERWRPHSFVTEAREFPEFGPLHYGLGWRLDTVEGKKRVWHSGHCSGYTSLLALYPEEGFGVAAAVNCSDALADLHRRELQVFYKNQTL